jgi:hypothetical protein
VLADRAGLIAPRMMHRPARQRTICFVSAAPAPSPTWRWGYAGAVKGVLVLTSNGLGTSDHAQKSQQMMMKSRSGCAQTTDVSSA